MKVTVNSKKGLKTNLKVFVDKKTIEEKINNRLIELKGQVNLKGFRPGKVPVEVIKRQFGKAVYGEILEKILQETSTKAINEKKIKIAGQPKIDLKSYGEGKDLSYNLEIEELPSFSLKTIENINFTEYEINVTKNETKKRIEDIAKNQNNFKDKKADENSQNGDLVSFDYTATINDKPFEGGEGKNTQIILGKNLFLEGFDKQLLGLKKNQEKEVTAILPANYPKKEFANKKAVFKCKVLKIQKAESVKIDDNFAKNLGAKDLSDLERLVQHQVQNQYKMSLNSLIKENILNQLEKMHDLNLPENLIQQEIMLISQGQGKDDIEKNKKENEKIARKRIKLGLILNALGEKYDLKVDELELKNAINKQVQSMPGQEKQIIEYYKKNPSATASLRGSIYEEKIISLIKEKSKKSLKTITTKEAEDVIKIGNEIKKTAKSDIKKEVSKKSKKAHKSAKIKKKIRKK